ncbi:hypothetical protein BDK51DRAFT_35008 [Blyttiomyces helicus]|uniref:Uncharacterized protein n=1 Tax=Blyttiomyces helicus TaxID=388810 RepID=A0A4P9W622_9FUNG|nr:hypothetical protein BDK51DRAFT_35008 [Blyttiomyces helicus]|eukprot:RKO87891.1 hypothetical protein BDK51DRAFT_35008 [Blyttiomyces helicus]
MLLVRAHQGGPTLCLLAPPLPLLRLLAGVEKVLGGWRGIVTIGRIRNGYGDQAVPGHLGCNEEGRVRQSFVLKNRLQRLKNWLCEVLQQEGEVSAFIIPALRPLSAQPRVNQLIQLTVPLIFFKNVLCSTRMWSDHGACQILPGARVLLKSMMCLKGSVWTVKSFARLAPSFHVVQLLRARTGQAWGVWPKADKLGMHTQRCAKRGLPVRLGSTDPPSVQSLLRARSSEGVADVSPEDVSSEEVSPEEQVLPEEEACEKDAFEEDNPLRGSGVAGAAAAFPLFSSPGFDDMGLDGGGWGQILKSEQ